MNFYGHCENDQTGIRQGNQYLLSHRATGCYSRIDTPLTEPMAEDLQMDQDEFDAWLGKSVPMKRMGKTSELGDLGVFLGSDESTYITGYTLANSVTPLSLQSTELCNAIFEPTNLVQAA